MKILITGSDGFVAKNLILNLSNFNNIELFKVNKKNNKTLESKILKSDVIVHLAGTNRSKKISEFKNNNYNYTKRIINIIEKLKINIPIIYSSTTKITDKNIYGKTKKKCEELLADYSKKNKSSVYLLRLPNIFGKWSKPNYNSVIATFCFNILNNKKISLYDENEKINLIYIDDLIKLITNLLFLKKHENKFLNVKIKKVKKISLKKLRNKLLEFKSIHNSLYTPTLNNIFEKNLYSTFISYCNANQIYSDVKLKESLNGNFIELFKNKKFGQVSVFTTPPKKIRGMHYHNSKIEKFFIVQGNASINYYNEILKKNINLNSRKLKNKILITLPGWIHTVKNTGTNDLIIIVWSNEIFNIDDPDTYVRL